MYRASGLSPMQYESAGKRRDGTISREGSVALRRALIDLGIGLWLSEPHRESLCRETEITRQARRDHRQRPGPSRHPHRPCLAPRPRQLRPVALGPEQLVGFPRSRPSAPETQELSTCSARSAARTNDVDSDDGAPCRGRGNPPQAAPFHRPWVRSAPPAWRRRPRRSAHALCTSRNRGRPRPSRPKHRDGCVTPFKGELRHC